MSQSSRCNHCGTKVRAHQVDQGRAFFRCGCGKSWSGRAYYGQDPMGSRMALGGLIGTAISGGLDGGLIGAALGAIFGGGGCRCLRCGGTGYPTATSGRRKGYQCENCHAFWTGRA